MSGNGVPGATATSVTGINDSRLHRHSYWRSCPRTFDPAAARYRLGCRHRLGVPEGNMDHLMILLVLAVVTMLCMLWDHWIITS
jgi:hypothetical protein